MTIIGKFFTRLERLISFNWFNPFATIYLNMRTMPLSKALRMPVWVYGRPRIMELSGKIMIEGKIKSGMIRFNYVNFGPSNMGVQSEIALGGTIIFKGKANIRTGNRIGVGHDGVLELGRDVIIADYINIGCYKHIKIGDNVRLSHRSQLFDSNYHYVVNLNKGIIPPVVKSIEIGSHCWICNSCSIYPGTVLPAYTIVSKNSMVNKSFAEIPQGSIIGGMPAKLIASGFKLVNNTGKEAEITCHYEKTDNVYVINSGLNEADWFEYKG